MVAKAFEENKCQNPMCYYWWKWEFNQDVPAFTIRILVCFSDNRSLVFREQISLVCFGC